MMLPFFLFARSYWLLKAMWYGLGWVRLQELTGKALCHLTVGRILHCPWYRGSEVWLIRDQWTFVYSLLKLDNEIYRLNIIYCSNDLQILSYVTAYWGTSKECILLFILQPYTRPSTPQTYDDPLLDSLIAMKLCFDLGPTWLVVIAYWWSSCSTSVLVFYLPKDCQSKVLYFHLMVMEMGLTSLQKICPRTIYWSQ